MALTTSLNVQLSARQVITRDLSTTQNPVNVAIAKTLTDGFGAGKADRVFADSRSLGIGAAETFNMSTLAVDGGAGAIDNVGQSFALTAVRCLLVHCKTGTLVVGGDATADCWNSPFGGVDAGSISLGAGGLAVFYNPTATGYAVGAGNNLLKITNADAGASTYDIVAIGSAAS